ncbi:unnamed protein product, partial [Porites lobata]
VRTQYDKLIKDFVKKEREEKKATGIDADYDELDQLLNDTYERASDAAADLARQAEEKEKAACDEKQQAEDIRTQAMERQEKKQPNKRKSTALKELLEEGRKSKNDIEMKRIALEEPRLQVDKERHTFFENVVTKQQQQQALLLNQQTQAQEQQQQMMKMHLENQQQQQVFQQQQQKAMADKHNPSILSHFFRQIGLNQIWRSFCAISGLLIYPAIQTPAEFLLHLKCLLHKLQGLELLRTRCRRTP